MGVSIDENTGSRERRLDAIRQRFTVAAMWRYLTPDVRVVITRDENGQIIERKLKRD